VVQIIEKWKQFRAAYIYLLHNYENAFRELERNIPKDRKFRKGFPEPTFVDIDTRMLIENERELW
jgi:hypothetical protein